MLMEREFSAKNPQWPLRQSVRGSLLRMPFMGARVYAGYFSASALAA